MAAAGGHWVKAPSGPIAGQAVFIPQTGGIAQAYLQKTGGSDSGFGDFQTAVGDKFLAELGSYAPIPKLYHPKPSAVEFEKETSADPIHAKMQPAYQAWKDGLSAPEAEAVKRYTGFYEALTGKSQPERLYWKMNDALRNDKPLSPTTIAGKTQKGLDTALAKGKLPFDLVTFRGYQQAELWSLVKGKTLQAGTELSDKAFTSTSQKWGTATYFTKKANYPVVLKITAKAGSPGAYVTWKDITPKFMHESEILLPRNSVFTVKAGSMQIINGKETAVIEVNYGN